MPLLKRSLIMISVPTAILFLLMMFISADKLRDYVSGQDNLNIFLNFTKSYPDSTGFYGLIDEVYYDGTLWEPDADFFRKIEFYDNSSKVSGIRI